MGGPNQGQWNHWRVTNPFHFSPESLPRGIDNMNLTRRHILHLVADVTALPVLSHIARAQTYPARPVRITVGFPAGAAADIGARLIAQVVVGAARPAVHYREPAGSRDAHRHRSCSARAG
jgi:hypothetical protein